MNENDEKEVQDDKSKTIGWIEIVGLLASVATIVSFILDLTQTIALSTTAILLLVLVTGIIWLGSIISKLGSAVEELRNVRREIVKIQKIRVHIDGKDNQLVFSQDGTAHASKSDGSILANGNLTAGKDIKAKSR